MMLKKQQQFLNSQTNGPMLERNQQLNLDDGTDFEEEYDYINEREIHPDPDSPNEGYFLNENDLEKVQYDQIQQKEHILRQKQR